MSANLTVYHPNISIHAYPWTGVKKAVPSALGLILTQSCVMTASIEMKSLESEAPLRGEMVEAEK